MKDFFVRLWKDEEGAETAEWIVIVALITAVAVAVYVEVLEPELTAAVESVGDAIDTATTTQVTPTPGG